MGLTIKEISSMSGYSVSTVSKALNDKNDISLETRNTIKGIARKFNYIPNNYALALRGKKKKSIAIILPTVTISKYNQALYHLQRKAINAGFRVLLYQTFNSSKSESNYIKSLNDGSVDGIFIISNASETRPQGNLLKTPIIPINLNGRLSTKNIERLTDNGLSEFVKSQIPIQS
ncbi:LacI family DNA-binding transcriptional regulator [Winogradskyella sp.]|uniref:LacI family DNA-binding transcriptional regulator n=1 Tax=Winogradskyella sp. TaxID=1883156 RepID=UPI003BACDEE7